MTISTAYGYSSTIYPGVVKPASTDTGSTGSSNSKAPQMVATDLRQDVGVEVTLSPAALQMLAQQAAAANTPDEENQITEKMKQILSTIFLESGDQAEDADAEQPPLTGDSATDTARKAAAKQATDFIQGKAANPFTGKTPAELAAIIVDKDSQYTVNERRAAYSEFARQDNARILDELTPKTDFDKKVNDAEVPKSGTADRIASAKQATDFINAVANAKNPFADKSRDELTAIIDNDTGDYTVNERRAALQQRNALEKGVLADLAKTPNLDEQLKNNSETVPGASDDEVARERAATRFVNGYDKANPFAGLTREELNAIVYDETDSYTTNERRAAYAELKQYLPASSQPDASGSSDGSKSSNDNSQDNSNPYNTGGAYSQYLMQKLIRAQNTSYFLSLLGSGGSTSSSSGGGFNLVNYLT